MSSLNESGMTPEAQAVKAQCITQAAEAFSEILAAVAVRRQASIEEVAA